MMSTKSLIILEETAWSFASPRSKIEAFHPFPYSTSASCYYHRFFMICFHLIAWLYTSKLMRAGYCLRLIIHCLSSHLLSINLSLELATIPFCFQLMAVLLSIQFWFAKGRRSLGLSVAMRIGYVFCQRNFSPVFKHEENSTYDCEKANITGYNADNNPSFASLRYFFLWVHSGGSGSRGTAGDRRTANANLGTAGYRRTANAAQRRRWNWIAMARPRRCCRFWCSWSRTSNNQRVVGTVAISEKLDNSLRNRLGETRATQIESNVQSQRRCQSYDWLKSGKAFISLGYEDRAETIRSDKNRSDVSSNMSCRSWYFGCEGGRAGHVSAGSVYQTAMTEIGSRYMWKWIWRKWVCDRRDRCWRGPEVYIGHLASVSHTVDSGFITRLYIRSIDDGPSIDTHQYQHYQNHSRCKRILVQPFALELLDKDNLRWSKGQRKAWRRC